jgi:SpoVK/Ycf46/Vps4 family AAA+-type ATPase
MSEDLTKEIIELFDQTDDTILDLKVLHIETQEKIGLLNELLEKISDNMKILVPPKDKIQIDGTIDQVNNLDDLLILAKKYGSPEKDEYLNINTKILYDLISPLEQLNSIIGMDHIKEYILELILTSMQDLYDSDTMFHTVITGSPGVGKTMLAKLLGEIYLRLGILKNEEYVFKIAKRSDLIGKYLGHTAMKTQELLDSCEGGVIFIDEIYSLGNDEKRDSFSKECIDTINLNLTEKKNFVCIVAGYPEEIESCFFAVNPGLKRRFPFRYDIKGYEYDQLAEIFRSKILASGWKIDIEKEQFYNFFKENKDSLTYFGGDIDNLIMNCRTCHSKRVFGKEENLRRIIIIDDLECGFQKLHNMKHTQKEKNDHIKSMYL